MGRVVDSAELKPEHTTTTGLGGRFTANLVLSRFAGSGVLADRAPGLLSERDSIDAILPRDRKDPMNTVAEVTSTARSWWTFFVQEGGQPSAATHVGLSAEVGSTAASQGQRNECSASGKKPKRWHGPAAAAADATDATCSVGKLTAVSPPTQEPADDVRNPGFEN